MSSVQTLWLSRSYGCPDLITVQILWLSRSYDCPDLMIVRYSCMLSFISYGCPDLMVVHILLLSTSYGLTLWLSGSYGYILWYLMVVRWHLMVVHVDGCPVDGCPLTWRLSTSHSKQTWSAQPGQSHCQQTSPSPPPLLDWSPESDQYYRFCTIRYF